MGRIGATERGPSTVGHQGCYRHLIQDGTCPVAYPEVGARIGSWLMPTFRVPRVLSWSDAIPDERLSVGQWVPPSETPAQR